MSSSQAAPHGNNPPGDDAPAIQDTVALARLYSSLWTAISLSSSSSKSSSIAAAASALRHTAVTDADNDDPEGREILASSSSSSASSSVLSIVTETDIIAQHADVAEDDNDDDARERGSPASSSSSSSSSYSSVLMATTVAEVGVEAAVKEATKTMMKATTTEWHRTGGSDREVDAAWDVGNICDKTKKTMDEERRGAMIAAISLLVILALLVTVVSSSLHNARPGVGGTVPPTDRIPMAGEVLNGDGNDKFVIGEEELILMEMEGDLYYYDDDDGQYHYDVNDDAEYDGSDLDLEVTEMAVEQNHTDIAEVYEEDDLVYSAYSTTQDANYPVDESNGLILSEESGEVVVGSGDIRGANDGGECSVVRPVDYNSKYQRGTGYESFPGYQCYRTVEGTKSTVIDLLAKYPTLTSRIVLSDYPTSERGQYLRALIITNKNKQPPVGKGKMLVVSSIHARELATAETMTRFAEYLLQQYGVDPDVTWIVDYTEIHVIFHANPDGREYLEGGGEKTLWKKNRNKGTCASEGFGVDPNRNFPFKWGKCITTSENRCSSSGDCSSVVYRGPSSTSEQETKAILAYAKSIFPSQQRKGTVQVSEEKMNVPFAENSEGVFIDVHSHGRDVGWPWGFANQRTPNDAGLGALGRKFASFSGYSLWAPKMSNRVYGFDGSTIDTMYGWLGAASFFFEIGTSFYQPCNEFPTVINEIFPALLYAAKVAKQPYKTPRGPDVLCTTITSTISSGVKYIVATIQVSDSARAQHADDSGVIFSTGRQALKSVEIYVNCHPLYSSTSCQPRKTISVASEETSKTVTLMFKSPSRVNNVMYIQAIDSDQYAGPITARKFVGG